MTSLAPSFSGMGCAGGRDLRAEMAAGHHDGNAPGDMLKTDFRQDPPLLVGQQELFGIVGQNADSVDALVDHAVEHAALAFDINVAIGLEGRRGDGK